MDATPINHPRHSNSIHNPLLLRGRARASVNNAIVESYDVLHEFMDWAKYKPTIEDTEEQMR